MNVVTMMRVCSTKLLFVASLLGASAAAGPGLAADHWRESVTRGLHVYDVGTKTEGLHLVCDPDNVFQSSAPNGSLVAFMPKEIRPTMVALLNRRGETVKLPQTYGQSTDKTGWGYQASVKPEDWKRLVGMFQKGGKIAVVTAHDSFTLDLAAFSELRCN